MDPLIQLFHSVDPLSVENIEFMAQHLEFKRFLKGEYFFEKVKVCKTLGFVVKGVFRVMYDNESGEERTKYFINEGHFAVDLESFNDSTPSQEYLQALEDIRFQIDSPEAYRKGFDRKTQYQKRNVK